MKNKIILNSNVTSVSTLLIPKSHFYLLEKKEKEFGSISKFLQYLVCHINPFLVEKSIEPGKGTVSYQSPTKFIKRNFRPRPEDWEILRMHAFSLRISMTLLFVLLMLNEKDNEMVKGGVPTPLTNFTLTQHITLTPIFTYIELNKLLL